MTVADLLGALVGPGLLTAAPLMPDAAAATRR